MELSYKIPTQMESKRDKLNSITQVSGIVDRRGYNVYRQVRKKISKIIDQFNYHVKALNSYILEIRQLLIDNENGVYLDGIGYFCLQSGYKRMRRRGSLFSREVKKTRIFFKPDEDFKDWKIYSTPFASLRDDAHEANKTYEPNLELLSDVIFQEKYITLLERDIRLKRQTDAT